MQKKVKKRCSRLNEFDHSNRGGISTEVTYSLYSKQVFFKENVRHPAWTCRDPMIDSRDPMINFSDSRDPHQVPKAT